MHLKLVGAGTLEQPACLLTGVESWCCQAVLEQELRLCGLLIACQKKEKRVTKV